MIGGKGLGKVSVVSGLHGLLGDKGERKIGQVYGVG